MVDQEENITQIDGEPVEILEDDYPNYDLSFKLIVIGDSGVGKSCLTSKATKNIFEPAYNTTIGFEFFCFNLKIKDKVVKLQIWDTCGQELYRSLITNFYRNSSLAIMVYSVTSKASFTNIETWLKELKTHSNPDAKVFLIGNKSDLVDERVITLNEAKEYANTMEFDYFAESSAKTGYNARNIFIHAAKLLYDDYQTYKERNGTEDSTSTFKQSLMSVQEDGEIKRKKECSC